jgi:hypothetical protein
VALVTSHRRPVTIVAALALKFRGLLIAVVVLMLSAGLALAGGGLEILAGSGGATDGSAPVVIENGDGDDADSHGDLVSEAAQMDTPVPAEGEGFKNHGAFVSCVARKLYLDPEADPAVEIVLAELTPEDCDGNDDEDEVVTDDPVVENGDEWDNHGDLVSDAAQIETLPDGFETRGAFVSCVAKMAYGKKGVEAPTDFALSDLTTDDCDGDDEAYAEATADDGPGKSQQAKGKGKGKGHGRGR